MMRSIDLLDPRTTSSVARCSSSSFVMLSSSSMPKMPFIGVRISWLMVARKALLAWLAVCTVTSVFCARTRSAISARSLSLAAASAAASCRRRSFISVSIAAWRAARSARWLSTSEISNVTIRNSTLKPMMAVPSQALSMFSAFTVQMLSGAKFAAAMPV